MLKLFEDDQVKVVLQSLMRVTMKLDLLSIDFQDQNQMKLSLKKLMEFMGDDWEQMLLYDLLQNTSKESQQK